MAGLAGLEPVTSAVTGRRSNQLSYNPKKSLNFCFLFWWRDQDSNLDYLVMSQTSCHYSIPRQYLKAIRFSLACQALPTKKVIDINLKIHFKQTGSGYSKLWVDDMDNQTNLILVYIVSLTLMVILLSYAVVYFDIVR